MSTTAVAIGEEGANNPTTSLMIHRQCLHQSVAEIDRICDQPHFNAAMLTGNKLAGQVVPLVGPGTGQ